MYFSIRDDDVSFYTKPEELIAAYDGIDKIPISLSVVPYAYYRHGDNFPYDYHECYEKFGLIGNNALLVDYIKDNMHQRKYEILMHGIHHKYYKDKDNCWVPEMKHLRYAEIKEKLPIFRKYLEDLFDCNIDVFVAPSNWMNSDTFRVLDELGLSTMCLISKNFDHPISIPFLFAYIKRNIYRFLKVSCPIGVISYKNHNESPVYPLDNYEDMWKRYLSCKKNNCPYIIYTHYWEINNDLNKKQLLNKIVEDMIEDGAKPKFVSEVLL